MTKLNIGLITAVSGRWPRELPNQRNCEYKKWLEETFKDVNIIALENIVVNNSEIRKAAEYFKTKAVDLVVYVIGAFTGDDAVTCIGEELKVPVIIWAPDMPPFDGGRLMSNALVAATMNAAAMYRLGLKYNFVYGSYADKKVADEVVRYIKVYDALKKLKQTYLGLLGYRPTAFYSSTFDETLIRQTFGITMEEFDLNTIFDKMENIDKEALKKDMAEIAKSVKIEGIPQEYVENHSRLYLAIKELQAEQGFTAANIKCWPEMGQLKTTPCAVMSRFADEGFVIGCEGDIDATITMLIQTYLTNQTVFMSDLIDINEEKNAALFWHCGQAGRSLKDPQSDIVMSNHPLAGQGTAFYTTLKPGKVTIARMSKIDNKYKLFLVKGEAIPTERTTKGVMVNVVLDEPVRKTIYRIAEEGVPHHYSIVWEDVGEDMKVMCKILGIEVIEI